MCSLHHSTRVPPLFLSSVTQVRDRSLKYVRRSVSTYLYISVPYHSIQVFESSMRWEAAVPSHFSGETLWSSLPAWRPSRSCSSPELRKARTSSAALFGPQASSTSTLVTCFPLWAMSLSRDGMRSWCSYSPWSCCINTSERLTARLSSCRVLPFAWLFLIKSHPENYFCEVHLIGLIGRESCIPSLMSRCLLISMLMGTVYCRGHSNSVEVPREIQKSVRNRGDFCRM